jgi:hypothetical protein
VLLVPAVGHACELERARLGRPRNSEAAPLPATASVSPRIEYWALEPLADRLKQTGNFCAKMLGEALGLAPPVRVEPRAEPLLIAGPPGSRAEPEPRAKETIDGR